MAHGTVPPSNGDRSHTEQDEVLSRTFYAKTDKDAIAAWKQEFNKILQIFNVRSVCSIWRSLTVFVLLDGASHWSYRGHQGYASGLVGD